MNLRMHPPHRWHPEPSYGEGDMECAHGAGHGNHEHRLWAVLMFQSWWLPNTGAPPEWQHELSVKSINAKCALYSRGGFCWEPS